MMLLVVNLLFSGYLASFWGYVAAETTAVLLGGGHGGKTETYPCDLVFKDTGYNSAIEATVLNGHIVCCGNWVESVGSYRECYRNEGDDWIEIESMNEDRIGFTLTTLGDKMIAAGGWNPLQGGNTYPTSSIEIFDGSSWTPASFELTVAREGHCAVALSERLAIFIGGRAVNSDFDLTEIYDVEEGFTAQLSPMPTARTWLACAMYNDKIFTAGGWNDDSGFLDTVEILTLGTYTWEIGATLTRPRSALTMHVLDGSLVAFGGAGPFPGESEFTLERYDEEAWGNVETLEYYHAWHTSVTIQCN